MKKLFIISAMAVMAFTANAQKGNFYVSASNINFFGSNNSEISTGFNIESFGKAKTTTYGFAPELGYHVSDRVAVGAALGFSGRTVKDSDEKKFNFGVNPYVRYFLHQSENFGFYLQGGVDFLQEKREERDYSISEPTIKKRTFTTWGVSVVPGVSYALSSHFSLLASFGVLGYTSSKEKDAKDATNTFGLNLDASTLQFSLRYTF
jgi:outer membrane protein